MHPFTGIEITDKGIALLGEYVAAIREVVGMEIPLAADHFGHIGVNSCIKLGTGDGEAQPRVDGGHGALAVRRPAEADRGRDDVPILTGEDIYLKEDFVKLIDMGAVDMIHPDLATAGRHPRDEEDRRLRAWSTASPMAMHFAGTPISFMANVHCAAATENFIALEHHSLDVPWWNDLVTAPVNTLDKGGFAIVPDRPGLGVEPNPEVVKAAPARARLLRAHAAVGQRDLLGPAVELGSRRAAARRAHPAPDEKS